MIFFLISIVLINTLFVFFHKQVSTVINVYDIPDKKRKFHKNKTPITGGSLVLINLLIYGLFVFVNNKFYFESNLIFFDIYDFCIFLFTCILIFLLGYLDDKFTLGPNKKFFLILIIIFPSIIFSENLIIENVRLSFFEGNINLKQFSLFWTLLCFLLFINAFNMFDGINLQVAIYSKILCVILLLYGVNAELIFSLIICLLSFSFLNIKSKSFFGDGGTYLLSYIFGYLFIKLYNSQIEISSDQIVLAMLLPGIELLRLFILRIINKKNPFLPDRNHLHHYLLKKFDLFFVTIIIQSLIIFPLMLSFFIGYNFLLLIVLIIIYFLLIIKFK